MIFGLLCTSWQVFCAWSFLTFVECVLWSSHPSRLLAVVLVFRGLVCELAGTAALAVAVLAERLGYAHTPAKTIRSVSKKDRMPLWACVAVGAPGSISCWKGCRSEALGRHPQIGDSVGRPCDEHVFCAPCTVPRPFGLALTASLRSSREPGLGGFVVRLTAL